MSLSVDKRIGETDGSIRFYVEFCPFSPNPFTGCPFLRNKSNYLDFTRRIDSSSCGDGWLLVIGRQAFITNHCPRHFFNFFFRAFLCGDLNPYCMKKDAIQRCSSIDTDSVSCRRGLLIATIAFASELLILYEKNLTQTLCF